DAARAGTPVDAAAAERYRASLTAVLAQPSIDVEAAADALADVDRLAVLAPEDPLVTTGRNAIAEHLGAAAAMLVTGERFDAAVAMLEGALDLIAESATLRDTRS